MNACFNPTQIISQLDPKHRAEVDIHYYHELDSTNSQALAQTPILADRWQLWLSEVQSGGRGRLGRHWQSPACADICMSLSRLTLMTASQRSALPALSLVVALAVVDVLMRFVPTVRWQVKWPNDIWGNGQKMAGILLESQSRDSLLQWVVGVGVNVHSTAWSGVEPAPTSLLLLTGQPFDRSNLVASLVDQLICDSQLFFEVGLAYFIERWQLSDGLYGKTVTVNTSTGSLHGIAMGIDSYGRLCVEMADGCRHSCAVGEASLSEDRGQQTEDREKRH